MKKGARGTNQKPNVPPTPTPSPPPRPPARRAENPATPQTARRGDVPSEGTTALSRPTPTSDARPTMRHDEQYRRQSGALTQVRGAHTNVHTSTHTQQKRVYTQPCSQVHKPRQAKRAKHARMTCKMHPEVGAQGTPENWRAGRAKKLAHPARHKPIAQGATENARARPSASSEHIQLPTQCY